LELNYKRDCIPNTHNFGVQGGETSLGHTKEQTRGKVDPGIDCKLNMLQNLIKPIRQRIACIIKESSQAQGATTPQE